MKSTTTILALVATAWVAAVSSAALAVEPGSEKGRVQANLKRFD